MTSDRGTEAFRDNVNVIVAGMNAYRSDLPTQARCMAGLVTLFKDRMIMQNLQNFMLLEKEHGLFFVTLDLPSIKLASTVVVLQY